MYYDWKPYVPVAQKLAKAKAYALKVAKKEKRELTPAKSAGRKIATSFWGQAWCDNLNQYSDFSNRLARGRTYLGNGSVVDLQIKNGLVEAIVAGSEVYKIKIQIKTLPAKAWAAIKQDCARSIHSLLDLLQGRFDEGVMKRLVQPNGGLFPKPADIDLACSCPDYADVCKHLAAVVYGVGVRLDASPELLFTLRNVDHSELITQAVAAENLEQSLTCEQNELSGNDLSEMFGIDLETAAAPPVTSTSTTKKASKVVAKKAAKKKVVKKTLAKPVATKLVKSNPKTPARTRRGASF